MTNSITVRTNLPEFKRELQALGQRIERQIVRRSIRAAGTVFAKEAKRIAPVLDRAILTPKKTRIPGALRAAIRVASSRKSRKLTPVASVFVKATAKQVKRGADPFYWRFLEAGWIPRGPGQRFKGGPRRRALERERALASGATKITKYRFLQPAFQAKKNEALDAFIKAMNEGIAKENAKRGK